MWGSKSVAQAALCCLHTVWEPQDRQQQEESTSKAFPAGNRKRSLVLYTSVPSPDSQAESVLLLEVTFRKALVQEDYCRRLLQLNH